MFDWFEDQSRAVRVGIAFTLLLCLIVVVLWSRPDEPVYTPTINLKQVSTPATPCTREDEHVHNCAPPMIRHIRDCHELADPDWLRMAIASSTSSEMRYFAVTLTHGDESMAFTAEQAEFLLDWGNHD